MKVHQSHSPIVKQEHQGLMRGRRSAPFAVIGSLVLSGLAVAFFIFTVHPHINPILGGSKAFQMRDELEKHHPGKNVNVGVYFNKIFDLDMPKEQFAADFYVWFRWKGNKKDKINFEFTNAKEVKKTETILGEDAPGDHYLAYRVTETFHTEMDLKRYPFDEQVLAIEMEDSVESLDDLKYSYDPKSSIGAVSHFSEWNLSKAELISEEHSYSTNFGEPDAKKDSYSYSKITWAFHILRNGLPYLLKTLFPLLLIILTSGTVFFIAPAHVEVRGLVPVTALLTIIGLQVASSVGLPSIGYATLLDHFFLLGYLLVFCVTVQFIATTRLAEHHPDISDRLNRLCGLTFVPVVFFLFGILKMIETHGGA